MSAPQHCSTMSSCDISTLLKLRYIRAIVGCALGSAAAARMLPPNAMEEMEALLLRLPQAISEYDQ
eukprot:6465815-Amphidinium_carterae.1